MMKHRFSANDRMNGFAAAAAFLACFAVVIGPSFLASLVVIVSDKPWVAASQAEPAAASPADAVRTEFRPTLAETRTEVARPRPLSTEEGSGPALLEPAAAIRSSAEPQPEGGSTPRATPVRTVEAVEPVEAPLAPLQAAPPERDLRQTQHVKDIQGRLAELGFLSARPTGVWGPLSREALKSFREAYQLGDDAAWDAATEQSLFAVQAKPASFVGVWGADPSACSARLNRKGFLPAVIDDQGAFAGETSCAFKSRKQVGDGWEVVASCANARDRWTARVRLAVTGNRLTWSSQRGSQTYVRCERGPMMAEAR